jgi:hypothetical protein
MNTTTPEGRNGISDHPVVSREEWVKARKELLKTLDAELFHTLAEEEKTIDRRERIRLLTAALATQVVLGAVSGSLGSRDKQA